MNTTFFVFNIFTFISSGCSDNESFFFSVFTITSYCYCCTLYIHLATLFNLISAFTKLFNVQEKETK